MGSSSLIVLMLAAIAFAGGGIAVARFLVRSSKNPQKGQAYECGVPTEGTPWNQFNVGYYLFALIFLIFDVELIFLYPWAVIFRELGLWGLVDMLIFIAVLFLGLIYTWKRGALSWETLHGYTAR